jgi:hypothetical protein
MNKMIKIKHNIWLDVTKQCQLGQVSIQEIMNNFTLFILYDDNTYQEVEFVDEVVEAISLDLKIIIYVGKQKKQNWFHQAKKILNNGYWYVRIADLKL